MVTTHILLVISWIMYCFIHSLLADIKIKDLIQQQGISVESYTRYYNLLAVVLIIPLIYFQLSVKSVWLFKVTGVNLIAGMVLIITGAVIMIHSMLKYFRMLREQSQNGPLLQTSGIHGYVRHPLYSGTFLFILGIFLCRPLMCNMLVAAIIIGYTIAGIRFEEKKLVDEFGDDYKKYKKRVPGIVPRLLFIKRIIK